MGSQICLSGIYNICGEGDGLEEIRQRGLAMATKNKLSKLKFSLVVWSRSSNKANNSWNMRSPHSYIWLLDVDTWKNKFHQEYKTLLK